MVQNTSSQSVFRKIGLLSKKHGFFLNLLITSKHKYNHWTVFEDFKK